MFSCLILSQFSLFFYIEERDAGEHKVHPSPCAFAGKKENLAVDSGRILEINPFLI
jgi:hypothetical protein